MVLPMNIVNSAEMMNVQNQFSVGNSTYWQKFDLTIKFPASFVIRIDV